MRECGVACASSWRGVTDVAFPGESGGSMDLLRISSSNSGEERGGSAVCCVPDIQVSLNFPGVAANTSSLRNPRQSGQLATEQTGCDEQGAILRYLQV